ncbi:DoxX family protein [Brevundimonas naejangsanensis]|uniref:DoxX family protein n=1 Tax=Brevundimonas naejangsanensis TaxID=588932 RepID=A0A494RI88_9CAUL|nr:DoxX family protein [Brevundimonas naejangsanensis]AYG96247.1 DoxX family protein [Brevundimonas naejangsanensis]
MTTSTLTHQARARADYLNLALWTFQGWIAMFFIAAGYAKLTESMTNLTVLMKWPALASETFVRGLGVAELVLAAMVLTPLISWRFGRPLLLTAAAGLLALEVVALGVHAVSLDIGLALTNVFLIAITAPVLWLRRR